MATAKTSLNIPPVIPDEGGDTFEQRVREARGKRPMAAAVPPPTNLQDQVEALPTYNEAGAQRFLDGYQRMDWSILKLPRAPKDLSDYNAWSHWIAQASRQCILIIDQWAAAVDKPVEELRQVYAALDECIALDSVIGHDGPVRGKVEHMPTVLESIAAFQDVVHQLTREIREVEVANPHDQYGNPEAWGAMFAEMAFDLANDMTGHEEAINEGLEKFIFQPMEGIDEDCAKRMFGLGNESGAGIAGAVGNPMHVGPQKGRAASPARKAKSPVRVAAADVAWSALENKSLGTAARAETNFEEKASAFVSRLRWHSLSPEEIVTIDLLPNGATSNIGDRLIDPTMVYILRMITSGDLSSNDTKTLFQLLTVVRRYFLRGETAGAFNERFRRLVTRKQQAEQESQQLFNRKASRAPAPTYQSRRAPDDLVGLQSRGFIEMFSDICHYYSSENLDDVDDANKRSIRSRFGIELLEKTLSFAAGGSMIALPTMWQAWVSGPTKADLGEKAAEDLLVSLDLIRKGDFASLRLANDIARHGADTAQQVAVLRAFLPNMTSAEYTALQPQFDGEVRSLLGNTDNDMLGALSTLDAQASALDTQISALSGVSPEERQAALERVYSIRESSQIIRQIWTTAKDQFYVAYEQTFGQLYSLAGRMMLLRQSLDTLQDQVNDGTRRLLKQHTDDIVESTARLGVITSHIVEAVKKVVDTFALESNEDLSASHAFINSIPSSVNATWLGGRRIHLQWLKGFIWPLQPLLESHLEPFTVMRHHHGLQLVHEAEQSLMAATEFIAGRRVLAISVPEQIDLVVRHVTTHITYGSLSTSNLALLAPGQAEVQPVDMMTRMAVAVIQRTNNLKDVIESTTTTYNIPVTSLEIVPTIVSTRVTYLDLTKQVLALNQARASIVSRMSAALGHPSESVLAYYTSPDFTPTIPDWVTQNLIMVRLFSMVLAITEGSRWTLNKFRDAVRKVKLRETDPVMRLLRQRIDVLETVDEVFGTHLHETPFDTEVNAFHMFVYDMSRRYGNKARDDLKRVFGDGTTGIGVNENYAQALSFINDRTPNRLGSVRIHQSSFWNRWYLSRDTFWVGDAIRAHAGMMSFLALHSLISAGKMYTLDVPIVWGAIATTGVILTSTASDYFFHWFVRFAASFGSSSDLGPHNYYRGLVALMDRIHASTAATPLLDMQLERIGRTFGPGDGRALNLLLVGLTMLDPGLAGKVFAGFMATLFMNSVIITVRTGARMLEGTHPGTKTWLIRLTNMADNLRWWIGPIGLVTWMLLGRNLPTVAPTWFQPGMLVRGLGELLMNQVMISSISNMAYSYLWSFALARTTATMLLTVGAVGTAWSYMRANSAHILRSVAFRRRTIAPAAQQQKIAADSLAAEQLVQYDLQAESQNRQLEAQLLSSGGSEVLYKSRKRHAWSLVLHAPVVIIISLVILYLRFGHLMMAPRDRPYQPTPDFGGGGGAAAPMGAAVARGTTPAVRSLARRRQEEAQSSSGSAQTNQTQLAGSVPPTVPPQ